MAHPPLRAFSRAFKGLRVPTAPHGLACGYRLGASALEHSAFLAAPRHHVVELVTADLAH